MFDHALKAVLAETVFNAYLGQERFLIMLRSAFLDATRLKPLLERYGVRMLGEEPPKDESPDPAARPRTATRLADEDYQKAGDIEYVAELTAKVVLEASAEMDDDGVTQSTTMRKGARVNSTERVRNPVKLIPFRTFTEVPQPMSEFLLRLRAGEGLALCEADGGAWRWQAMQNIRHELEFLLAEKGIEDISVIA